MKGLFKLIPVALAVFAFASCSNDDFFGGDSQTQKPVLSLEVENMGDEAVTRSAYVADGNSRVWMEGDQFVAYSSDMLGKYDYYTYAEKSNAFELFSTNNKMNQPEPAFVAFPFDNIISAAWNMADNTAELYMGIPSTMEYGEIADSKPTAYVSDLPLWGTCALNETADGVNAKVYFLTAIIKVTIDNALNNASKIRVSAWEDIAGTKPANISGVAKAVLAKDDVALAASEVQLGVPGEGTLAFPIGNTITVDMPNDKLLTNKNVFYIPLVAGHYGKVLIDYYDGAWHEINHYYDKDFVRATPYGKNNTKSFAAKAGDIPALNTLIQKAAGETKDVELDVIVSNTTVKDGDIINVPASFNPNKLTILAKKLEGAADKSLTLAGDYSGTVVLNSEEAAFLNNLTVIMPKATVVLQGDYSSEINGKVIFTEAKNVVIGDIEKTTKQAVVKADVKVNDEIPAEVGDIIVAGDGKIDVLTLSANHRTANLTVNGICTGAITVPASEIAKTMAVTVGGQSGNISATEETNNANIVVNGTAGTIATAGTGYVTLGGVATSINNKAGGVTINGKPNYTATNTYAKVGDVTTTGDVTVALENEGAAIGGELQMSKGKTLTLTQGYVMTVKDPAAAGSAKKLNITFNEAEAYIAINSIAAVANVTFTNAAKWNGETFGGSLDTKAEQDAAGVTAGDYATIKDKWDDYVNDGTGVCTGIDLQANNGTFTLINDVDLNNKTWTPTATTGVIDGGGKTISNLKVAVPESGKLDAGDATTAATAGLGLFSDLKNNVSNLTLDGVTIEALKFTDTEDKPGSHVVDNIGALAGKVTAAAGITAVTVKNVNLSSTGGANAIGGVVGTNTAALTLTGVKLEGKNSIQGYYRMGGFVGYAAENVTIATKVGDPAIVCAATASFKANHNSATTTPALDKKYLSIGNFIGEADHTKKFVIACAAVDITAALTADLTIFPGYTKHNVDVNFYDYVFGQHLIGWSGDTDFPTPVSINGKDYQRYANKATWKNATEYLYYIDM